MLNLASIARTPGRATEVVDTILQATNLQILVLSLRLQDLYLPPDWPTPPTNREEALAIQRNPPKSVDAEYLMRQYQFPRLFSMKHMNRLIINIEHGFFEHTPQSIAVLGDLRMALMAGLWTGERISGVTCQEVDVRRPGMSIFILAVTRF
jgi:hypothetical protein